MRLLVAFGLGLGFALAGCATAHEDRARLVQTPNPCVDKSMEIYFGPSSANLTREGRSVIDAAAAEVRGCAVLAVEVVGLADAAGAPSANLELAKRRADAVSKALAAAGLPPAKFLGAQGDVGAIAFSGAKTPLRRRVDVTLRLAPAVAPIRASVTP